ncbi:hypothetical protein JW887_01430 [Candidatus Dojkabacteria bacterium]|nr:hypothetical protein [Candidatus Dojkabacteria bacterium]
MMKRILVVIVGLVVAALISIVMYRCQTGESTSVPTPTFTQTSVLYEVWGVVITSETSVYTITEMTHVGFPSYFGDIPGKQVIFHHIGYYDKDSATEAFLDLSLQYCGKPGSQLVYMGDILFSQANTCLRKSLSDLIKLGEEE